MYNRLQMQKLGSHRTSVLTPNLNYFPGIYLVVLGLSSIFASNQLLSAVDFLSLHQIFITMLLIAVLPWISSRFRILYPVSLSIFCTLSIVLLIQCLIFNEGISSLDLFWLAAIPLLTGVSFGMTGAYGGLGFSVIMATICLLLQQSEVENAGSTMTGNTNLSSYLSLLCFLLFEVLMINGFIRHQVGNLKTLSKRNLDIENLLRVLVHDIGNSLTGMTYNIMIAKEISEQRFRPSCREFERIERAVEDISNLLSQVRHLKSVKDGKATLQLKPLSLNIILHEVYEKSLTLAQHKGIRLAWEIAQDRMMIHSEKAILSNVILQNILSNAIKFSFPGDPVEVRAFPKGQRVIVEIQDYGVGIPPELQSRIFLINSLTTRQGTQGEKGTGYGMPLVKEYLQMMNGEIEIISREHAEGPKPRGTRVILSLPLAEFEVQGTSKINI